jgi:hypothetical protein
MNRFYLIAPLVLAALFGGVYWQHSQRVAAHAVQQQTELARAREAADRQKSEAERKAREDADRRTAERLAEEQKRETEKRARQENENRVIAEDTQRHSEQLKRNLAELDALNAELVALRATKETQGAEAFELARSVELDRIKKRNAEWEIQRLTEILVSRANGSSLASAAP